MKKTNMYRFQLIQMWKMKLNKFIRIFLLKLVNIRNPKKKKKIIPTIWIELGGYFENLNTLGK